MLEEVEYTLRTPSGRYRILRKEIKFYEEVKKPPSLRGITRDGFPCTLLVILCCITSNQILKSKMMKRHLYANAGYGVAESLRRSPEEDDEALEEEWFDGD